MINKDIKDITFDDLLELQKQLDEFENITPDQLKEAYKELGWL